MLFVLPIACEKYLAGQKAAVIAKHFGIQLNSSPLDKMAVFKQKIF